MAADQALTVDSTNTCCAELKKKCQKLQESRNVLRQAVKVLEQKINEVEAQNANLEKAYNEERTQAKIEKEEKRKEFNARVSLEDEACRLKSEITTLKQKCERDAQPQDGNKDMKNLQACISDREKEINNLKELLEKEKKRAVSEANNAKKERKKAAEAWKLLEIEKNKMVEKGTQIAKIEAEKADELKQNAEKLAYELSKAKEAIKSFEAEKQKLLEQKRNAVSDLAKSKERLELEKQMATREKRRADAEKVKVEEQKKLAEDNLKKAVEEKRLADQMSQQLEECKQRNVDLKKKIYELSSLRKPIEVSGDPSDICAKVENTKVKLLEKHLKLEKTRAKRAREKVKLEARHCRILQLELSRIKLDLSQVFQRLETLDPIISHSAGSIDDFEKTGNMLNLQKLNVTKRSYSSDLSQMHSQSEHDLLKSCYPATAMNACDPLKKNMQHTPFLYVSGVNCADFITGIDSKLEPLTRGSNRTKLKSSAINSSTTSFSDGQLVGSQDKIAFPATASAELAQENINARSSILADKTVTEHSRKRTRVLDTVECTTNLNPESKKFNLDEEKQLSDLHGLLYKKVDKSFEGVGEMVPNIKDHSLENSKRCHKKRKKSHKAEKDVILGSNKGEKKDIGETKAEVREDTNIGRDTSYPAACTKGTTHAFRDRTFDATNDFDSLVSFLEAVDGDYMKLLDLENSADEECYRRAMDFPLSPSLHEIEFHEVETYDRDNSKPFLEEALHEDMLSPRGDLFPSPYFDVIDVEINTNGEKCNVSGVSSNSQQKPVQPRETEVVKMPQMCPLENSRAPILLEGGIESLHNQLPNFYVVCSTTLDESSISRVFCATKRCSGRCSLITQTGWIVDSILAAVTMEGKLLPREKISVLFTLLLFNFTTTTSIKFRKLFDGNLHSCLNSYAEHICTVMSDATRRIQFLENFSLHELLSLIEDFVVEGKLMVSTDVHAETLSKCDLRTSVFLDQSVTWSSEAASSEQLVSGSIILASLCAATDYVGFICESSYNILRLCRSDSLIVLTILHVYAYLGGGKLFNCGNFGLVVTVIKSLVMFLEAGNLPVATASSVLSINRLHTELCTSVKCPLLDGAEPIDNVAILLLENIKNRMLQDAKLVDSLHYRSLSDKNIAGQCFNQEAVHCVTDLNCDALSSATMCHLSDVLSLVELVANRLSWQWTDMKFIPQLLSMLDSCVLEDFSVAIIVLLGQLGRLGVDTSGYEDTGVEKLRCYLFAYLCDLCDKSSKEVASSLLIATASALLGLLPLDVETLFQTNTSLPVNSCKFVSRNAEKLRKLFSELDRDKQDLLCNISRTDVYKKK